MALARSIVALAESRAEVDVGGFPKIGVTLFEDPFKEIYSIG